MSAAEIKSLEELKKARKPLRNVNAEHRQRLSSLEKLSLWITEKVGSMGFFLIIFCWTIFWLAWNTLGPQGLIFDPFPAFVLWLFMSNMIQIFLMPLIMIGQNIQSKHAEQRSEADYEVNLRTERETELIISYLEENYKTLKEISSKIQKN